MSRSRRPAPSVLFGPDEAPPSSDLQGREEPLPVAEDATPVLRNVVHPKLLELAQDDELRRFFAPYEAYLTQRGVFLEGTEMNDAWRSHLHRVLVQLDPTIPVEMQQGLVDIADVVSERAHDDARTLARGRQLPLFDTTIPVDIVTQAFRLYLDQPRLFRDTLARQHATRIERFAEFHAREERELPELTEFRQERFRAYVAGFCAGRNRTAYCSLHAVEVDNEVQLHVLHGRPPRSQTVIENGEKRSRHSFVPDRRDLLVYDRTTGSLAVSAQSPTEQEFYRETFGRVFFGAPGHFSARMDITAKPLLEQGVEALVTDDIPSLRGVRLREVRVQLRDRRKQTRVIRDENMGEVLDEPDIAEWLGRGDIVFLRFDFLLQGQRRIPTVLLMPPNKMIYDRRLGAFQAREFLIRRGFVVLPQVERDYITP